MEILTHYGAFAQVVHRFLIYVTTRFVRIFLYACYPKTHYAKSCPLVGHGIALSLCNY